jgi:anti-anti-sigma factor
MDSYSPSGDTRLLVETRPLVSSAVCTVVVTLAGELDVISGPEIQRAIDDVLDRHHPDRVCLDMQQVTFLDSAGIRALLICRQRTLRRQCELQISRAHENVRQVLAITSLLDVFHLQNG